MTFQHQFHLKLDFSQMTVYCTGTYTQRKTVMSPARRPTYRLEKWEKAWGMEFHPEKCNSMSITRARSPFEHRYTLKGHILEDVKEAKYLGLTLSSNLTWNTQETSPVKQINYLDF